MFARLLKMAAGLARVDKARYLVLGGGAVLAGAALLPWAAVPSSSTSALGPAGALALASEAPWPELLWRLAALLGGLSFVLAALRPAAPGRWVCGAAWLLGAALLAYPCWVTQWAPQQNADARLLYFEMERVINDMERNTTEQQVDWRDWQVFTDETLADHAAVNPTEGTWNSSLFAPNRWDFALGEVLGVSPELLGFFRPPLLAALLNAVVFVLLGLHAASGAGLAGFTRGLCGGLLALGVLLAVPLVPRAVGEHLLAEADRAFARGEQQEALRCLVKARAWKPALRYSWWYRRRLGQVTQLLDRGQDANTYLALAYEDFLAGRPGECVARLYRAQELAEADPSVRLFLGLAFAEAGLRAFNNGQFGLAKDYWEEALARAPTNPMPWYGLSLLYLRTRQFDRAARCSEQVVRLQKSLGYRRLTAPSQAYLTGSWAALGRGDLPAAHDLYSRSLTPENW
jgi:tetratricopeptide (TPR) repeat protein